MAAIKPIIVIMTIFLCKLVMGIPQVEVNFSIFEEIHTPGALVKSLRDDPAVRAQLAGRDLSQTQFQYLSEEPDKFAASSSGDITTTARIDRDVMCPNAENCDVKFDLFIQQSDLFLLVKISIQIQDINDNDPVFEQSRITLEIPESTQIGGSYILPKIIDPDSARYSVTALLLTGGTGVFEVRHTSKPDGTQDMRLELKSVLDREHRQEYQLQVTAKDGGDPPRSGSLDIRVIISDANDNRPVFAVARYEATVPENAQYGYSVATVHATDIDSGLNGEVVYGLSEDTMANLGEIFKVDNQTGMVTVIGEVDYETSDIMYLTIQAYDRGTDSIPGEAVIIVHVQDENDHAPEITVHTLGGPGVRETSVREGIQTGAFVGRVVVSDLDSQENGRYECSLSMQTFQLEPLGSDFLITTLNEIDRETQSDYELDIVCRDFGLPSKSATAHISVHIEDENDNAPFFSETLLNINLLEDSPVGTVVLKINSTDADQGLNAVIEYSVQGQENQWFDINPQTGLVTLRRGLNREFESRHEISIKASDHGTPPNTATALLVVTVLDVNDELPIFTQALYTFGIFENELPGSEVGFVQAEDADASPYNSFTFLLQPLEGQAEAPFGITADTGRITTTLELDREQQSLYSVVVVAVDTSEPYFSSSATVSVYVMDRNDNPPRFTFPSYDNNTIHISNDIPVGYIVTRIYAADSDGDVNGQIKYELVNASSSASRFFTLDQFLGTVTLVSTLRHMDNATFSLSVIAKDSGDVSMSTSTTLNIVVNHTLSVTASEPKEGIMSNVTIVISVACLSGILIVALLLAIVILCRQRRLCSARDWHQKRRVVTEKAVSSPQPAVATVTAVSERNDVGSTTVSNTSFEVSSNQRYVSANFQKSTRHQVKSTELDLSLEKSRQWLDHMKAMDDKAAKEGKREADRDSVSSAPGSNTDSGRGASEQGDLGPKPSDRSYKPGLGHGVVLSPAFRGGPFGRNSFHGNNNRATKNAQRPEKKRSSFHGNHSRREGAPHDRHHNHVTGHDRYPNVHCAGNGSGSITSADSGNVPDISLPPSLSVTPDKYESSRSTTGTTDAHASAGNKGYTPILYARCHGTLNRQPDHQTIPNVQRVNQVKRAPTNNNAHWNTNDPTVSHVDCLHNTHQPRNYDNRYSGQFTTTDDDDTSSATSGSYHMGEQEVTSISQRILGLPQQDVIV